MNDEQNEAKGGEVATQSGAKQPYYEAQLTPVKCNICGPLSDFVEFVFSRHYTPLGISHTNPSDLHHVFMCPNNHMIDVSGEVIGQD